LQLAFHFVFVVADIRRLRRRRWLSLTSWCGDIPTFCAVRHLSRCLWRLLTLVQLGDNQLVLTRAKSVHSLSLATGCLF
jgi:hypothetical protein